MVRRFLRWLWSLWVAIMTSPCHFCHGTGTFVLDDGSTHYHGPCAHCQATGKVWSW
jgi:DnaJ-class molecular chaperone